VSDIVAVARGVFAGAADAASWLTQPRYPSVDKAELELKGLQDDLEKLKASKASHGEIRRAPTRVEGAIG
jgi:hypothetical protein